MLNERNGGIPLFVAQKERSPADRVIRLSKRAPPCGWALISVGRSAALVCAAAGAHEEPAADGPHHH
jgi:hypothetical protein